MAIEAIGHLLGHVLERRVCPPERLGVERVIAATLLVDPLDGAVEVADLATGGVRVGAVVDGAQDARQGAKDAPVGIAEEVGVLQDAGPDRRVHQLEEPDRGAHEGDPGVPGPPPEQRLGPQLDATRPGPLPDPLHPPPGT